VLLITMTALSEEEIANWEVHEAEAAEIEAGEEEEELQPAPYALRNPSLN
jgi:hypothetical protein